MMLVDRSVYRSLVAGRFEDVQRTASRTNCMKSWAHRCKDNIIKFFN